MTGKCNLESFRSDTNYLTFRFSENKGRVLENLVFLELKRRDVPIFYYKTASGHEVDFLVHDKGVWNMIQVCYDLSNIETFNREKRALIYGLNEVGIDTGTIITDTEKRLEQSEKFTLNIIPAWEWLLLPTLKIGS